MRREESLPGGLLVVSWKKVVKSERPIDIGQSIVFCLTLLESNSYFDISHNQCFINVKFRLH